MTDPVVFETCAAGGVEHAVPSEYVRVLRIGDGGFVIACSCGSEPLETVDDPPHPSVDHLVNVYADDPSSEEWLRLEDAADGWHDTTAWTSPEGYAGTNGQRRAQFREQVEALVDDADGRDLEPSETEQQGQPCPDCGSSRLSVLESEEWIYDSQNGDFQYLSGGDASGGILSVLCPNCMTYLYHVPVDGLYQ